MASIITNAGLKAMFDKFFNSSSSYGNPSKIKVGTGTTTPTINDTDLETEIIITGSEYFRDLSSGYPTIDLPNLQATMRAFLTTLDANGNNLSEFGVFTSDETMWSRSTFTPINKTTSIEISFVEKDKQ